MHVVMVPVELSVIRVDLRARTGGHAVPEDKIRQRHDRLWGHVAEAALIANRVYFWDNSGSTPRLVGLLEHDEWVSGPAWPDWTSPDLRTIHHPG